MKTFLYKGMVVTALTSDDAKNLGTLAKNYLDTLDNLLTKDFSMVKDARKVSEKKGSVNVDTKYYITNKSGKSLDINFIIVLRPATDGSTILSKSTIDYTVKIGKEFVTSASLSGTQIEGKNLKDALANVLVFVHTFSEL